MTENTSELNAHFEAEKNDSVVDGKRYIGEFAEVVSSLPTNNSKHESKDIQSWPDEAYIRSSLH